MFYCPTFFQNPSASPQPIKVQNGWSWTLGSSQALPLSSTSTSSTLVSLWCVWEPSTSWIKKTSPHTSDCKLLFPLFLSQLEALQVLTPKQLAEMLLLPLPDPTDKDTVMHAVFDFLLESPEDRKFTDVLHFVVQLAKEANPPCSVYQLMWVPSNVFRLHTSR